MAQVTGSGESGCGSRDAVLGSGTWSILRGMVYRRYGNSAPGRRRLPGRDHYSFVIQMNFGFEPIYTTFPVSLKARRV